MFRRLPGFLLIFCIAALGGCHHTVPAVPRVVVHPSGKPLQPGESVLIQESDYIVACSCTAYAPHHQWLTPGCDAEGAINDVRVLDSPQTPPDPDSPQVSQAGPSWVRPGEAAMGAIGLMAAAKQLHALGDNTSAYDAVLHAFFQTWLVKHSQPFDNTASDPNRGGVFSEVDYSDTGARQGQAGCNTSVTAQTLCALWKYEEYLRDTGQTQAAAQWLQRAWPLASGAGDFLRRCFNARYGLVQPDTSDKDLWTGDSALSCAALWCLARWATTLHQPASMSAQDAAMASALTGGLEGMKDPGGWHDFFRLRDSAHGFTPGYGNCVDQLCFIPYEVNAIDPGEPYAREISDWWTVHMTDPTQNPQDWKYFGTHWHDYFANQPKNAALMPQNSRLYPGPGLQLAKLEWKYANRIGDAVVKKRFEQRYAWAASPQRSDLWFGVDGRQEAGVPNGFVDWRDAANPTRRAAPGERFVDTSAYFLEATLMKYWNLDTKYVPE
jgi:hypothetical protein